jgi:hypothetical protein
VILKAMAAESVHVNHIAENPRHTDSPAWEKLSAAHLVIDRSTATSGGVKFYTALRRTSNKTSFPAQVEAIKHALALTRLSDGITSMASRSSLYCGTGDLADFLVRCVADDFDEVLDLVETLDIHLMKANVRPTTFLIANPHPREYDNINDTFHTTIDDDKTARLLALEARTLAALDEHDRLALARLVTTACELAGEDPVLEDVLLTLLRATASNSHDDFTTSSRFLVRFEPAFKKRIIAELSHILGDNWLPQLKAECAAHPKRAKHAEAMATNIKKWSLGTYLFTAVAAAELHPEFDGHIEGVLGPQWKQGTDALLNLRNDFAHGNVEEDYPTLNIYDAAFADYLNRLMAAAVLWRQCISDTTQTNLDMQFNLR